METKILKSFINKMNEEANELELIVSIDPETWEEEHICEVLETKDNGKVWELKCTRSGNVKEIYEL